MLNTLKTDMKPKLILVRGIPGSGKSTYARSLGLADHYEADMWFEERGGFEPTRLKEAHAWCQRKAREVMDEGRTVVVSNTFVRRWEMKAYIDHADALGIPVEEIVMTGDYGSIHNVPEATIQKMRQNFEP